MLKHKNPEYNPTPLEIAEEKLLERQICLRGWKETFVATKFSRKQIRLLNTEIKELRSQINKLKKK